MVITESIEKHSIKISLSVAAVIILFLLGIATNFATWKTDIDNKIDNIDIRQTHLAGKYVDMSERISILEKENTDVKVQMATIETKLNNIESLLIDIKLSINEK